MINWFNKVNSYSCSSPVRPLDAVSSHDPSCMFMAISIHNYKMENSTQYVKLFLRMKYAQIDT